MDPFDMKLERRLEYPPAWRQGDPEPPEEHFGVNYWFWCHPCDTFHYFRTRRAWGLAKRVDGSLQPLWTFNGNMDRPSFHASLKYEAVGCHVTLTDGVLQYHDDCKHSWKGRQALLGSKVPL